MVLGQRLCPAPSTGLNGAASWTLPQWSDYWTHLGRIGNVSATEISGSVVDASGNPLCGVTVTATWKVGTQTDTLSAVTDANGNYAIYGVFSNSSDGSVTLAAGVFKWMVFPGSEKVYPRGKNVFQSFKAGFGPILSI